MSTCITDRTKNKWPTFLQPWANADVLEILLTKINCLCAKVFYLCFRLVNVHAVTWICTMQGMEYLHRSSLKVHGILRSSNCLLNYRWTLKISDIGLTAYRVKTYASEYERYAGMLLFWILSVIRNQMQYSVLHVWNNSLHCRFNVSCALEVHVLYNYAPCAI